MNASTLHDALPAEPGRPSWAGMPPVILAAGVAAVAALAIVVGILAVEAPGVALLGVAGVAMLVPLVRPTAAVLAVVVVIYSNAAAVAVNFHGAPAIMAAAVPLLLLLPALYNVVRHSMVLTPTFPWLLLLLLVHMVSALLSGSLADSLVSITAFALEGILLFVLIVNSIRHHELMRRTVWALVLTGAAMGALSGLQQLTDTYYRSYFGFAQVGDGAVTSATPDGAEVNKPRLAGPIGEKNYYAQYWL
ncbi:MAG: hypothetical protein LC798_07610, partial [Chloroflexi bacterium]|nr:hypothetical protein [Chloroflexota bacterium]